MKTFVVNRTYGKYGSDYLHDWCDQLGTACMLSIDKALKFQRFLMMHRKRQTKHRKSARVLTERQLEELRSRLKKFSKRST